VMLEVNALDVLAGGALDGDGLPQGGGNMD
jgi:hypothetical protein